MADITIQIEVSAVKYKSWLNTSYIGLGIVSEDGTPLIRTNELGPDQEDAFKTFIDEAAREVEKAFISRQGDVEGIPFEYDGIDIIYRFHKGEPILAHSDAIEKTINEDVLNALFVYVTMMWFKTKGNVEQAQLMMDKYFKLVGSIMGNLYRLHD